ncbi:hypothetical protein TH25_02535 [Thalassospira profundimaris]|uniref:Uncharacterized protein n=1 Tax=Thalassospira profundimaris TaxID=502049 RepID=A0A367XL99_9PROT|nr:hypothetical protein [Thalassospira profundimaris]RCK54209.1 hypothetical protein TH25_02535 [Thalassospira profundimaris]
MPRAVFGSLIIIPVKSVFILYGVMRLLRACGFYMQENAYSGAMMCDQPDLPDLCVALWHHDS